MGWEKTWIHIIALLLVSCVQLSTLNYPWWPYGALLGALYYELPLRIIIASINYVQHFGDSPTPHHPVTNQAWTMVFKFNVRFHFSCHVQTGVSLKRGIIWGICIHKGEILFSFLQCVQIKMQLRTQSRGRCSKTCTKI